MPKKKNSKKLKVKEIKKKRKVIESKKSDLEENIEEFSEKSGFIPSFTPTETSPVLKKVEPLRLETNIASEISATESEPEIQQVADYAQNAPRYGTARDSESEEPRRRYESDFRVPILEPTRLTDTGREFLIPRAQRTAGTREESEEIEASNVEHQQRLPFEQEQRKYKKVKL